MYLDTIPAILRAFATDPNGCWEWPGKKRSDGYGYVNVPGGSSLAHRRSYEIAVGPIPEGLTIDHLCRNRICINPAHLEPVTNGVNVMRGEGVCVQMKRKTHCAHGHPFSEANTIWVPSIHPGGGLTRRCATCRKTHNDQINAAAKELREQRSRKLTTACTKGHIRTDENTYWHRGHAICRVCRRAYRRPK